MRTILEITVRSHGGGGTSVIEEPCMCEEQSGEHIKFCPVGKPVLLWKSGEGAQVWVDMTLRSKCLDIPCNVKVGQRS